MSSGIGLGGCAIRRIAATCLACCSLLFLAQVHGQVLFSEVFYRPAGTNVLEEWVELHNPALESAAIGGWRLTKGVTFAIPSGTVLPPGGFLVIAADRATFSRLHPGITNVAGDWTGVLSDDGEELELTDGNGAVIDSVAFAPEGDWAVRRLSAPDRYGRTSWEWFAEHDGLGRSLELINPGLPNNLALNWTSSASPGGTPGKPNSVLSTNVAPLISAVAHFPAIPKSTEAVIVSARITDEEAGPTATLHWRLDGAPAFTASPMHDDGAHSDGLPGDNLWGFRIPAQPDGTIIEYFVSARDGAGRERIYPAVERSNDVRNANLLLQFDDEAQSGSIPLYRLILSKAERDYIQATWTFYPSSSAEVNGTFVSIDGVVRAGAATQVRQNAAFRNRGNGSRHTWPKNFHVSFAKDRPWGGRFGINLNTQNTPSQMLGSELMRRAGMPMAESRTVRVRVNGEDLASAVAPQYGAYVANEQFNGTLVKRQFPGDPEGNLYRGMRDVFPGNPKADLAWHGASFDLYTNAYFKETNEQLNDYSDVVGLADALNNSTAEEFVARVRAVLNVDQWMRHFAMHTLLANQETTLATGYGDDYGIYRGAKDPRFVLIAYDLDTIMGAGTRTLPHEDSLFRMTGEGTSHHNPAIERLMKHPDFAPIYYAQLLELAETTFRPDRLNPVLERVTAQFPPGPAIQGAVENMKAFNAAQLAQVLRMIPQGLAVTNSLVLSNGYPRTTNALIMLHGRAHAARTRTVTINGRAATWTAWRAEWLADVTLLLGINRLTIEAVDESGKAFEALTHEVWLDNSSASIQSGTVTNETIWRSAEGPFQVSGNFVVASGATLRIEPGATVQFESGARLQIAAGGSLSAEGTSSAPILFSRAPGSAGSWGGVVVQGEARIVHAHFEHNSETAVHSVGGTVWLERLTFGNTDEQYVSLDDSSFVVRECHFPSATREFELVHGSGGIKPGGHGVFVRNYFGAALGYNDVIDFTGGQRPGPIVHFIDNVFVGSGDDLLDLDGTDAWVERNIFMHVHRNGSPDSASAVSGGSNGGRTSRVTVIGNLFYDCDHAALAKQGNFYALLHNTIVRQTKAGGLDDDAAVLIFDDENVGEGAGMHLEGNIIYDAEKLTRNLVSAALTVTNNLMPFSWTGLGGGNSSADPLLARVPPLEETRFESWDEAQVMWEWLGLKPGAPGLRKGRDLGADGRTGVSAARLSAGENAARFAIELVRTGSGVMTNAFPQGSGFMHYRWRIDGGNWSSDLPTGEVLELANLSAGEHILEVSGKLDSGMFQDDPRFAPAHSTLAVRFRMPDEGEPRGLRINELLAKNVSSFTHGESTPDFVELHNDSDESVALAGVSLSDDPAAPRKFTFANGLSIPAGGFLLLLADSDTNAPGIHLGFSIDQDGETITLTDKAERGGALIDSIAFGAQIADRSVGRRADGTWGLCVPTPGEANRASATAAPAALRINEWLANARFVSSDDFIELYNPSNLPAELGGCFISDAPGTPNRHRFPPLSFVGPSSTAVFRADGNAASGPNHLGFKLSSETGTIHLLDPNLALIDVVSYGPKQTDVSQGRSPSGAETLSFFAVPTPGSLNPGLSAPQTNLAFISRAIFGFDQIWRYEASGTDLGADWRATNFNDSGWTSGAALFGADASSPFPYPLPVRTALPILNGASRRIKTFYFRTRFDAGGEIAGVRLRATNYLDDGAVFYINGERAGAIRVKDDPALHSSDASNQGDEGEPEEIELSAAALRPGENLLAVEVHQAGSSSSDVMFGMALTAVQTITNVVQPARNPAVLNELLVWSQTVAGPSGRTVGWVELHNPSTNEISLHDLSLSDTPSVPRRWVFPAGTAIPPGGFVVVETDSLRPASTTNTGFGLPWNGGTLHLFDAPAQGGRALDSISFGLQTPDFAVGRMSEGGGERWTLTIPTSGTTNAAAGLGSPEALRLNEWMADPAGGADWFEICNLDGAPVALSGLFVTDDLGNRSKSAFRPLSFIGTGRNGFVQLLADRNLLAGGNHADFRLGKSGSPLGIFAESGLQIDALSFGPQGFGVSEGRLPDGVGAITSFAGSPTPSLPNSVSAVPADFDGDGMPDEWEEANGLNRFANDAALDHDGDGLSNAAEFAAGTDPRDGKSTLELRARLSPPAAIVFSFEAQAGRAYKIESCDSPAQSAWNVLREIPAQPYRSTIEWSEPAPGSGKQFYRIVVR